MEHGFKVELFSSTLCSILKTLNSTVQNSSVSKRNERRSHTQVMARVDSVIPCRILKHLTPQLQCKDVPSKRRPHTGDGKGG